jgi:secreted PhoX family phosphatase
VVEVDPFDPNSVPKKRTALGRFKHEGADNIVATRTAAVVVYLGDDERFDYVYKLRHRRPLRPANRAEQPRPPRRRHAVCREVRADGTVEWLPLVFGQGPLTAENGFAGQADVLIEARRAGDLLGATKMDRPEDIKPNRVTGRVYVMLTNNTSARPSRSTPPIRAPRTPSATSSRSSRMAATSPRPKGTWDILLRCGDPSVAAVGASFSTETSENGWFGMPDNCRGRFRRPALGHDRRQQPVRRPAAPTALGGRHRRRGAPHLGTVLPRAGGRGALRPLLHARRPHRCSSPCSIRAPTAGLASLRAVAPITRTFSTRWPDFKPDMPTRPSVVAITKTRRRQDRRVSEAVMVGLDPTIS